MGALYSTQSLQLLAHFCIQEHLVTFDPDKEIHFDELPFREPRQRCFVLELASNEDVAVLLVPANEAILLQSACQDKRGPDQTIG